VLVKHLSGYCGTSHYFHLLKPLNIPIMLSTIVRFGSAPAVVLAMWCMLFVATRKIVFRLFFLYLKIISLESSIICKILTVKHWIFFHIMPTWLSKWKLDLVACFRVTRNLPNITLNIYNYELHNLCSIFRHANEYKLICTYGCTFHIIVHPSPLLLAFSYLLSITLTSNSEVVGFLTRSASIHFCTISKTG
ncbi:hypothetical protein L9F63_017155, partial [Diploptera punctata]